MSIQEVADQFYTYMQVAAYEKIYSELYSPDATSDETPGSDWEKAIGMEAIFEKGKKWNDIIEAIHGGTTEKPVIAGNYFSCLMTMDFTPKGGERTLLTEIGLYHVVDGKIVSEQFFY